MTTIPDASQRARTPAVDVIIAVHSASRPIARAVASIVEHTAADVRVIVVAHNIDREIIRTNLGPYAIHDAVWLTELQDGVRSPAGPMNVGFEHATAPFIALLGSDDEFAPGAVDSWLECQRESKAQAVLTRITLADGRTDPYPPVRGGRRTRHLDPVRDRLAYRSAPLGLIERATFGELRLTPGLPSGEDLVYGLRVHFTADRLAYDLHHAGYVINDDSGDRVTYAPRPLALDFAFLDVLEAEPWFCALSARAKMSILLKVIRIHFFDAIAARVTSPDQLDEHRASLVHLFERLVAIAPDAEKLLSIADTRVINLLTGLFSTSDEILAALTRRHRAYSPATLLPRSFLRALDSQAPFRTLWTGYLIQKRYSSAAQNRR